MLQHPAEVRAAFEEGAATLLRTLRAITLWSVVIPR